MKLDRSKFILLDEAAANGEYATKISTFLGNFAPKKMLVWCSSLFFKERIGG
jgi:hypothetical protein